MRELKVIDAPWFKIIDGTGAFSTASAKLLRNRRFRSNYLGHAHPAPSESGNVKPKHSTHEKGFIRIRRAPRKANCGTPIGELVDPIGIQGAGIFNPARY